MDHLINNHVDFDRIRQNSAASLLRDVIVLPMILVNIILPTILYDELDSFHHTQRVRS